jgi:hypothetical protein
MVINNVTTVNVSTVKYIYIYAVYSVQFEFRYIPMVVTDVYKINNIHKYTLVTGVSESLLRATSCSYVGGCILSASSGRSVKCVGSGTSCMYVVT